MDQHLGQEPSSSASVRMSTTIPVVRLEILNSFYRTLVCQCWPGALGQERPPCGLLLNGNRQEGASSLTKSAAH